MKRYVYNSGVRCWKLYWAYSYFWRIGLVGDHYSDFVGPSRRSSYMRYNRSLHWSRDI